MRIQSYKLGQLQTNCYFVIKDDQCIIIDPGDEANFILEKIQQLRLMPIALLATHGHFDHVMAVGEIQLSYNIPFYIHKNDLFLLDRMESSAEYFLGHKLVIIKPKNIKNFSSSKFRISGFEFRVLFCPGHTPGSVSFYIKNQLFLTMSNHFQPFSTVFSGDTLFKQGIGRYDFSYSSKADLDKSLQKIFKLPPETIVYPGHGEPTTVDDEKKISI